MELGNNKMVTTSWLLLVSVVTSGAGGGSGSVYHSLLLYYNYYTIPTDLHILLKISPSSNPYDPYNSFAPQHICNYNLELDY